MFQRVDVTLDQKQVGTRFDWNEPRTRYVDAMSIMKVLDGRPSRGFKLKGEAVNKWVYNPRRK
jgi:hypothetical protein